MPDASAITALLGPTNTGKTHRAIERMLEHSSGMIGLPLRLLAREVYDKVSAIVGEAKVALVTGEERRVPPRPTYWVCTVEAMPVGIDVDFVAIDEVQLAAHDQRGHVFTSRILRARGRSETWFLGAETIRGVLHELVPTARDVEHPRLSQLTHKGASPLSRLPPRTAVVAFSVPHVYELADRIRARKGGAAVVLGALSPRTRNAQVAMFQAGEVDWLVASDAIGMGLNLDVDHVAFAALRKFDGRDVRDVEDAELAQIAGRAGRWIQDGSFGTITPLEIPRDVAFRIEAHSFPRVTRVRWRNDELDFTSTKTLKAALSESPRRGVFRQVRDADDHRALLRLAERAAVADRATDETRVRLLWDVAGIPDFRKLLFDVHVAFLEELFVELVDHGRARDEWLEPRVRELENEDGDVETLVSRIASTRIWTYVTNKSGWTVDSTEWRERTRALEDRLSDALHERLVLRFVDAKRPKPSPRARPRPPGSSRRLVVDDLGDDEPMRGHPFAALAAMRAKLGPGEAPPSRPRSWVEAAVDAPHAELRLAEDGQIIHLGSGRLLGSLVRGTTIARPDVRLLVDDIGAGARQRLQRRLLAFARDVVSQLLGPLPELARAGTTSAGVRGLVHRLEQGLGTTAIGEVQDLVGALADDERAAIEAAGVRFGRGVLYLPRGLGPEALVARFALTTATFGATRALRPPRGGAVSFVAGRGVDPAAYTALGFPVLGPRAIRADVFDRVFAEAGNAAVDPAVVATWLGAPVRDAVRVLAAAR